MKDFQDLTDPRTDEATWWTPGLVCASPGRAAISSILRTWHRTS
ncbi:hypothetical protein [Streptomyces sp. NPDC002187]